mmetsp:Transcript_10868/g.11000  ORF Transcript_10868/g.11000 Transcript_10868/m.11000 type:complete len:80 (+) Transcript_10868:124-363(+)
MQVLLLLRGQLHPLYFILHLEDSLLPLLEGLFVFLGTEEELGVKELLGEAQLHEVYLLHHLEVLALVLQLHRQGEVQSG